MLHLNIVNQMMMAMCLMFVHNQNRIICWVWEIKKVRLVNSENCMAKSNVFDIVKQKDKDDNEKNVRKKLNDA